MASFRFVLTTEILSFSIDQIECHIETSNGAGIQPKKAIKKVISTAPEGSICVTSKVYFVLNKATHTAIKVLIDKMTIMYFIKLSNNLYLPTIKKRMLKNNISEDHKTKSSVIPKSCDANPAVTIVTAA